MRVLGDVQGGRIRLRDAVLTGGVQTGSDDYYLGSTRKSESRDSLRPTKEDILGEILPALKKAIDSTDQRDINSSCMIAMAKNAKVIPFPTTIRSFITASGQSHSTRGTLP